MAPPKLTRDSPVAEILQPICVNFRVWNFREEPRALLTRHEIERKVAQLVHPAKPLRGNQRLNDGLAAFTLRDREFIVHDLFDESLFFEPFNNSFAGFVTIEALKVGPGVGCHLRELIDDHNLRQIMALPHFVIVRIMRWSNLYSAGSEFCFDVVIGDERNYSPG